MHIAIKHSTIYSYDPKLEAVSKEEKLTCTFLPQNFNRGYKPNELSKTTQLHLNHSCPVTAKMAAMQKGFDNES